MALETESTTGRECFSCEPMPRSCPQIVVRMTLYAMMQMASWAVLRLGLRRHSAVPQPRIVLLAQQPPAVRLKRRGEACELGTKQGRNFGGKRRMKGGKASAWDKSQSGRLVVCHYHDTHLMPFYSWEYGFRQAASPQALIPVLDCPSAFALARPGLAPRL